MIFETQPLQRLSTHSAEQSVSVAVTSGPDAGKTATVTGAPIGIGTAEGNALTLSDETVSRYHLELSSTGGGIRVVDFQSTNGTRVGAMQIERCVVPSGTELQLGKTKLTVSRGKDAIVLIHPRDGLGQLRGRTIAMRRLMTQIDKLAPSEAAVLLVGESGTGKELVAQALHDLSPRRAAPFVTVDCGALTESLVTSELFGHEQGAFTGAAQRHQGVFERARGGTVFLDEIGELPSRLQSHLLGVLERRKLRRVGGTDDIDIDVRVVSATNRDLRSEVNTGAFRLDLYYRLSVVCVELPPLRARTDDIPLLLAHFLEECGCTEPIDHYFPPATLKDLAQHAWPGNVRELRNYVEATLALGSASMHDAIEGSPPPAEVDAPFDGPFKEARAAVVHAFERRYLEHLVELSAGNVSAAARRACITRSHLFKMLKRHGLK